MGCDIHGYIEHRPPDCEYWNGFGGRINPGRNYALFGYLAGVRGTGPAMFPVRGIPHDCAYEANGDWWLYVDDRFAYADEGTSVANAEKWHKNGCAIERNADGTIAKVEHPDWHTPSWVSADELEKAVAQSEQGYSKRSIAYRAVIAAMRSLEAEGQQARFVFWFDN